MYLYCSLHRIGLLKMGLASLFQDSDGMISKSTKLNGKVAFSRDGVPPYPAPPRERAQTLSGCAKSFRVAMLSCYPVFSASNPFSSLMCLKSHLKLNGFGRTRTQAGRTHVKSPMWFSLYVEQNIVNVLAHI